MNMELFALIITWLAFGFSTLLVILINFIWYIAMNNMQRTLSERKLGFPTLMSIVSGIGLWVYYYGGPPL